MINIMGVSTGIASLVILSLYIYSPQVRELYSFPEMLWCSIILLVYWLGRIWILTGRGQMNQDPVLFAIKDKISYLAGLSLIAVAAMAKWGSLVLEYF